VPLPPFTDGGDLLHDRHQATLREVLQRFGMGSLQRRIMAVRLEHIYPLVRATGRLARFVVLGSFITNKPAPNDVDVVLSLNLRSGELCEQQLKQGSQQRFASSSDVMDTRKESPVPR
jgi:hypothetical protein